MKIIINGDIKPYYIQMLAMLFYPGERFPEEETAHDFRRAEIDVLHDGKSVRARAALTDGDRTETAEAFVPHGSVPENRISKIAAGGAFLKVCERLTGHRPPWGMLTGVRPARLAEELMQNGMSEIDVRDFFENVYRTTAGKARLAAETASVSRRLITEQTRRECSVYIAIPFCPTRCAYCSFVSYTSPKLLSMIPEYLEALLLDIDSSFELIRSLGFRVSTVYIGGGTPTVLDERQLERLLDRVVKNIDSPDEFTLEAGRPDTITKEKLEAAARSGVTRLSVNPQSLNDEVLRAVGRAHTVEQFYRAYDIAASCGIRDVNVDLIAGLPGDGYNSFCDSVDGIISLDPTNITVHSFSVKKSAEFKTSGSDVFDREGTIAAKSVDYAAERIMESGYLPYYMYRQKNTVGNLENIGYAKKSHEGLYNIYMMDEIHSIFALGASSVTKLLKYDKDGSQIIERMFEPKYPYEYLRERKSGDFEKIRLEKEEKIRKFFS